MENQKLLNKAIKNFVGKYKKYPFFKATEIACGIKTEIYLQQDCILSVGYSNTNNKIDNETFVLSALEAFKNFDLDFLN